MPRRREVPKRVILPDPKFGNVDVAKFVNVLMTRGKKSVAERIIYGALDTIKSKSGKDPLGGFTQAGQNVKRTAGRSGAWKRSAAAAAERATRFRSRCVRCGAWRSRCAGSARRRRSAARSR